MDPSMLRYIVFVLDMIYKQHDGKVFCSLEEAREFAKDYLNDGSAEKAVIGMFLLDPGAKEMNITYVESFGFKKDKKNVEQLMLFK
jgi:hypothetical protein